MTRMRLGGPVAGGMQFVSWIHHSDFVRAIDHLIDDQTIDGPVNLTSPAPLPQKEFMLHLKEAWGIKIGLPATKWMAEIGAFFLRTDAELLLKSRRVIPTRLVQSGFSFEFPDWKAAARDLVDAWKANQ